MIYNVLSYYFTKYQKLHVFTLIHFCNFTTCKFVYIS